MTTIAALQYIQAAKLSDLILAQEDTSASKLAIIDVRGDDYIGGHIRGSINVPSHTLDYKIPELVRKLKDKEMVVFHCALSQQRGPSAALRYLRERERLLGVKPESESIDGQKVVVLERGFSGWQEKYGTDERLTEAYVKDLWEDAFY